MIESGALKLQGLTNDNAGVDNDGVLDSKLQTRFALFLLRAASFG